MSIPKPEQGLKNRARSPGSIINDQYNEATGVQKNGNGTIGAISQVLADSTVATPVGDKQPLWVANRSASWQYIWIGKEGILPMTINASSGMALAPNTAILMFADESDDPAQSILVKSGDTSVHVTLLKY